ncbi:origin recognition complex subunit [Thraustotheca clavata]|uniref:Origin recognition complex subunit 1 n=1 Tax=Thraustotheca clavata TaxID=74557 RepID=A0A1W0A3T8_9STRA|nr:origin recognition complex subunit [Thraustotheca clavata]
MPPKSKKRRIAKQMHVEITWKGDSLGTINGETYFTSACIDRYNGESLRLKQHDVIAVNDRDAAKKQPNLALINLFWEKQDGSKWMEIRYFMNAHELPPSLKKKAKIRATKDDKFIVETTTIDELPIAEALYVESLEEFTCNMLYSTLTSSLTQLEQNDDGRASRSFVYSHRLKLKSFQNSESNKMAIAPEDIEQQLQTACDQLQLSSIPEKLIGREDERRQIYRTVHDAIQDGRGDPVYISGLPGMGKTATVKEIIGSLERLRDKQQLPDFAWIEVNGLHMPKPDMAYSIIWKALEKHQFSSKTFNPKKARECLHALFSKSSASRPVLVLLLDEMDFMLAGKNTVLYNLLEWQSMATSKLVLIGIANIMDLPERLPPKLRSRFGVHRIAFRSYTHVQIEAILTQRLSSLRVFEPHAIDLVAKSLAHQSGDIRKALMVCKAAAENALRRYLETKTNGIVTAKDVEIAQTSMSQSPLTLRLKHCSSIECIFLLALYRELKMHGVSSAFFDAIATRVETLGKTAGLTRIPTYKELEHVREELCRSDILRVLKQGTTPSNPNLSLTFSHEELQDAFGNHPIGRTMLWT